jgi:hypothetical protein
MYHDGLWGRGVRMTDKEGGREIAPSSTATTTVLTRRPTRHRRNIISNPAARSSFLKISKNNEVMMMIPSSRASEKHFLGSRAKENYQNIEPVKKKPPRIRKQE